MTLQRRSNLSESIYQNMKLKETDELLEIWSENDRTEWSDAAFEAIHSILLERLGNVPSQETLKSNRNRKKLTEEKVKIPLPVILIFSPFLVVTILLLLIPVIQPGKDDQWFTVLMLSAFVLFFLLPGVYFGWVGWFKGQETKQRIYNTFRKNKAPRGIFFRIHTLFLPNRYLPTYFLWEIRIFSIVLIYGSIKMFLLLAKTIWQ